jgi:Ca2+-binding EF-hand superfamily protein
MRYVVLVSLLFSVPVLAADPTGSASAPAPRDRIFEVLDTNRDGQLTFSEAFPHPQLSNAFNVLDTNADGTLSRAEASAIAR